MTKDWAQEAARRILYDAILHRWHRMADTQTLSAEIDKQAEDHIVTIISEHAPFKQHVAYMPVPRCDSCKHFEPHDQIVPPQNPFKSGWRPLCRYLNMPTLADFGCVKWEAK